MEDWLLGSSSLKEKKKKLQIFQTKYDKKESCPWTKKVIVWGSHFVSKSLITNLNRRKKKRKKVVGQVFIHIFIRGFCNRFYPRDESSDRKR